MTFRNSKIWMLVPLSLLATACDLYEELPNYEIVYKTPIELTVGGFNTPDVLTRTAVITDETGREQAFEQNTSLYMLMRCDNVDNTSKPALVTRTIMFALPQTDNTLNYSEANYSASGEYNKFVRFWDDCYARSSALSIAAVCTPGMGPNVANQTNTKAWIIGGNGSYANQRWTELTPTPSYPTIGWPIGNATQIEGNKFLTDQSLPSDGVSFIKNQDLCFTNNISDYTSESKGDRRIKFNKTTKKFGSGQLIFYHALSKLTFRIKMGEGFTEDQFKFNANTNIKLTNFYNQGTFNMQDGVFESSTLKKANGVAGQNLPIDRIYQRPALTTDEIEAGYKYILDALVVPGTDMTTTDEAVSFVINDNEYKLTMAQLYSAFEEAQKTNYFDSNKLKAGVHYVFTFTVGKTKIKNVTASVTEWETVEATTQIPSNARIKLNLEERGTDITAPADIYRAEDNATTISDDRKSYNWSLGYAEHKNVFDNATGILTTDWYWPNNLYYYHFRAIMPGNGDTGAPTVKTADEKDYVPLTSGTTYTDIRWGAPMADVTPGNENSDATTLKWTYDPTTNGFDGKDVATKHQINYAIGPTEDDIKLILFHMMSELEFTVTTSATDNNKVVLGDGTNTFTKVELLNYYPEGRLLLGNGLVQTTGDKESATTLAENLSASSNKCTFGIVPQAITDDLQLRITTPDHNQYYVKLKDIIASAISTNNLANPYTDNKIDRWYPGYKYKYTLNLLKKGVTDITATIVDWETVTAGNDNVQIK